MAVSGCPAYPHTPLTAEALGDWSLRSACCGLCPVPANVVVPQLLASALLFSLCGLGALCYGYTGVPTVLVSLVMAVLGCILRCGFLSGGPSACWSTHDHNHSCLQTLN